MARGTRAQGRTVRRPFVLGVLVVLLVAVVGLAIAWSQGTFESRLMYWRDRGQNCGNVTYGPNGALMNRVAAERAVICFTAAHARCTAAVLTRNVGGTDTSETDTFVVEPRDTGGGCDVGLHTSFGIVGSQSTTTHDVQCARMTTTEGALTIAGCQDVSDITMP